ncbi:hypothetical protein FK545_20480 (plasmid) [Planococcus glaciei]|nr:hypothetical protein [Planococcus glaciei]QDY46969.1 hypothetical protein FK545_20480 [Planococcus glaciei]
MTFQAVHKQLEGLYRWEERTLEPKQVKTDVMHAILNATHSAYQNRNVATVKDQGFPVKGFLTVFTERLETFEKLAEAAEKEKANQ